MGNLHGTTNALSLDQQEIVLVIWRACSGISLGALTLVILSMIVTRQFQKPHQQLIFTMFCATFGVYFFAILAGDRSISTSHPAFCTAAGFMLQLCWNANIVGVLSISVNLYRTIVSLKPMKHDSLPIFHFFIWTYSFFLSSLPLCTGSYGWVGAYCWIDSSPDGNFWRMVTLYWPMIGYDLLMVTIYTMIIYSVVRQRSIQATISGLSSTHSAPKPLIATGYIQFMLLYPLVFFVFSTPALVNRYYSTYTGIANFSLAVTQSVSIGLMGLAYSLVFGWKALKHWREILIRVRLLPTVVIQRCCPQLINENGRGSIV